MMRRRVEPKLLWKCEFCGRSLLRRSLRWPQTIMGLRVCCWCARAWHAGWTTGYREGWVLRGEES